MHRVHVSKCKALMKTARFSKYSAMIDCCDRFVSVANFSLGRKCNKFGLPLKSDSVNHCVLRRSSVEYILILWDRFLALRAVLHEETQEEICLHAYHRCSVLAFKCDPDLSSDRTENRGRLFSVDSTIAGRFLPSVEPRQFFNAELNNSDSIFTSFLSSET